MLTNLEQVLKIKKDIPTIQGITNNQKSNEVVQKAETTPDASNSCVSNVDVNAYPDYQNVPAKPTNISADEFARIINATIPENKTALKVIVYSISYARSFVKDTTTKGNGNFNGYNNNFGGISLYYNWAATSEYFDKQYSCVNVKGSGLPNGTSEPLVNFKTVEDYVKFMAARLENNVQRILSEDMSLAKYYVCFWPKENVSVTYYDQHPELYTTINETIKSAIYSAKDVKIITVKTQEELVKKFQEIRKKIDEKTIVSPKPADPNNNVVPQVVPICPPPTIESFSPLVGKEGTILRINGTNLDTVTKIILISKEIDVKDFTLLNSQTIQLTVPVIGTGILVKGKIELKSPNGNALSTTEFTYDPAIISNTTSSPGGYAGNNQTSVVTPGMTDNTNPQNTKPVTLLSKYETKPGGEVTNKLTVSVNPDAGDWVIENKVQMVVAISDTTTSNNTSTQILKTTINTNISNYVVGNVFTITSDNIKDMIFDNPVPPFGNYPIKPNEKITIQFVVKANAVDKVKNPQPTVQSFNFQFNKPTISTTVSSPITITLVYDSNDPVIPPQLGGGNAYYIKKNNGGYYGFSFNAPPNTIQVKNDAELFSVPQYIKQQIGLSVGPNTKYMNNIIFNGVGEYQIVITYRLLENPNQPLTVTSPKFTL